MENLKPIAFYLPQFHRVKENDEWWGEGFTEWSAVRASEPLFEGHRQPREPLNDYYYDLMDKSTMKWQTKLAEEYGIYGFCFYHYWFVDGKRILEKPAENLLEWTDISMPFCFSWANGSWVRTWANVMGGNSWSGKFETKGKCREEGRGVLLDQKYGREKEWREHFDYLLPFFKDKRYIRYEGKPVFVLYRPELMSYCVNQMIKCWKKWAEEEGLQGLYIILTKVFDEYPEQFCPIADAILEQEPSYTIVQNEKKCSDMYKKNGHIGKALSYDALWNDILENCPDNEKKVYFSAITDYDDTPRRGMAGRVFEGVTVEKFRKYFQALIEKSVKANNKFLFINAWNEWAEGMYLEPDKENKYGFLRAVKDASDEVSLKGIEAEKAPERYESNEIKSRGSLGKYENYFKVLSRWLTYKQEGKNLEKYFIDHEYKQIAIYGMGIIGKHLYEELKGSSVVIAYAIDRGAESTMVRILPLDEELPEVDAIIVTPTTEFVTIEDMLVKKVDCPIISLENVVMECF